jgi:deazaflavin-dependent oxidoreductase (nitroreductase family)
MSDFNEQVIAEFRANEGKVGGGFNGAPMVLLTTTGAKSGKRYTTPLVYLAEGDRMFIFASFAGAPTNPAWFHNIQANPRVSLEVGADSYDADATALTGDERDRVFAAQVSVMPGFADYQTKTSRVIPVVELHKVGPAGS